MEKNSTAILIVVLAFLVVISLFSSNLAGNAPKNLRNVNTCTEVGDVRDMYGVLGVIVEQSGRKSYNLNRCGVSGSGPSGVEYSRIIQYTCGTNGVQHATLNCPDGTICKTTTNYPKGNVYGPAAYC